MRAGTGWRSYSSAVYGAEIVALAGGREYFAGDRYQRRQFSEDTWNYELRPIIDKQLGRWYLDFNPTFDKSLHGLNAGKGWSFLRM